MPPPRPPPRNSLDPEGYYARLGLTPDAGREAIATAYRAAARRLHPDVPGTGDAEAFVAVKQAYDILVDADRRAAYDREARQAAMGAIQPAVFIIHPAPAAAPPPTRWPRLSDMPAYVWIGIGAILSLGIVEAVLHLRTEPPAVRSDIRPNAATVAPLSAAAHQEVLYGPAPAHLPGEPNFYVAPAATPAVLWRTDPEKHTLVPLAQLPPFSSVQAIRFVRQTGMVEVLVADHATGFMQAAHLTPGNAHAARRAYCTYNAGPTPLDGEVLQRRETGNEHLIIDNRAVQPAVMKLRDVTGAVAVSVFLAPGGHADVRGIPSGEYRPEYAIGELWSRACGTFAAGMRTRRWDEPINISESDSLIISADVDVPGTQEISEAVFEGD